MCVFVLGCSRFRHGGPTFGSHFLQIRDDFHMLSSTSDEVSAIGVLADDQPRKFALNTDKLQWVSCPTPLALLMDSIGPVTNPWTASTGRFMARSFEEVRLCRDALRVLTEPNAGGSSIRSEVLSMEYLAVSARCQLAPYAAVYPRALARKGRRATHPVRETPRARELEVVGDHKPAKDRTDATLRPPQVKFGASGVVTEQEVRYRCHRSKKVDFVCDCFGVRCGVSVTRALGYPREDTFLAADARRLLRNKLYGLLAARSSIVGGYHKGILHVRPACSACSAGPCLTPACVAAAAASVQVWCQSQRIARLLRRICPQVSSGPAGWLRGCRPAESSYSLRIRSARSLGSDTTRSW